MNQSDASAASTSKTLRTAAAGLLLWAAAAAACAPEPDSRRTVQPIAEITATHEEEANAIHLTEDIVRDLRLSTALVAERPGSLEVTALGEIVAEETRYAEVAPPAGGQIVRVLVGTNALVGHGAALAELRSAPLGRARADRLTAGARLDLARQTLERKQALARDRVVALREVQAADAAVRAADADAAAADAALDALGIADDAGPDTSLYLLRSPIAGRVLDRRAILGRYAEPTDALFTIADLSQVWVVAQAFERDAVAIAPGSLAHVTLTALPGREFDGRVTLIGSQVAAGSRTLPIRIALANPHGELRPGMSTSSRIEVSGPRGTIVTVPAAALQRVGDRWLAFVPKGEYEYEMRPIGRGRDVGPNVEVITGLRAGEPVVVEGAFLLKAEAEKRAGVDAHAH